LDWIRAHPSRWKTFVANRVTEIQERIPYDCWFHVPGIENPADCAFRGIDPSELLDHPLWWKGPLWLQTWQIPHSKYDEVQELQGTNLEEKQIIKTCSFLKSDDSILNQFSTMNKLIRVTAWIQRFVLICRIRNQTRNCNFPINNLPEVPLGPLELEFAQLTWIRVIQKEEFH